MKTMTIGAFAAKTHFSELLEKAHQGTIITLTRRGKPVAQMGPSEIKTKRPVFGSEQGRVRMKADFDEPLPSMAEYTL